MFTEYGVMSMDRIMTVALTIAALLVTAMAGTAAADDHGVTADELDNAGWGCFELPLGLHCTQDLDALFAGEATALHVMVFDHDGEEFLGTELLLHDDVFNDQPCPQDGGAYLDVAGPYWACHHYETDHDG